MPITTIRSVKNGLFSGRVQKQLQMLQYSNIAAHFCWWVRYIGGIQELSIGFPF
jgi:hypothetical protein